MPESSKSKIGTKAKRRVRKSKDTSAATRQTRQAATPMSAAVNGAAGSAAAPARPSKKSAILALLQRPQGAAIGDLTDATGWQTHSVRAALTGLRKEGKELARIKNEGGVTHYRLAAGA
jgi:hypothetical protein